MKKKNETGLVVVDVSEVLTEKQQHAVTLAKAMKKAGDVLGGKFREFVSYCRANLLPKEIAPVMRAAGLPDSRCSEIKTVCALPDSNYRIFEQGQLGFKASVEKGRELKRDKTGRKKRGNFMIPVLKGARTYLRRSGQRNGVAVLHEFAPAEKKAPVICLVVSDGNYQCEIAGWHVNVQMGELLAV
jgi:hypothetical protein